MEDVSRKRISKAILNCGKSMGELAKETNLSKSTIHSYAHGETKKIRITIVKKIAEATNEDILYLMDWSDVVAKQEVNAEIQQTIEALDDEQKKALLEIARQMIKNK